MYGMYVPYIGSWCTILVKQLVAVGTAVTETNIITNTDSFIFDMQYFTSEIKHILYTKICCLQFLILIVDLKSI